MKAIALSVESGRETGSGPARRLRAAGRVPGVVYGEGKEARLVSVDWPELRQALTDAGSNALVELSIDGGAELALVYGLQRDPVKLTIDHVDFLLVKAGEPIAVTVPLRLTGVAEKVSRRGAVVEQQLNEIHISAPPSQLPAELLLDITEMTIEENLTVQDLDLPAGVELIGYEPDQVLAVGKKTRATLAFEREQSKGEDDDVDETEESDDGEE